MRSVAGVWRWQQRNCERVKRRTRARAERHRRNATRGTADPLELGRETRANRDWIHSRGAV